MARKKRVRKVTVYGCIEGEREDKFLKFLAHLYDPKSNGINIQWEGATGGAPDKFVHVALNASDRDKSFAWLDEDFEPKHPLSRDAREFLAKRWNIKPDDLEGFYKCSLRNLQITHNPTNRNPLLIVSHPVCVESIILQALGQDLPFTSYDHNKRDTQIDGLKNKLNVLIGDTDEEEYYKANLSIPLLDQRRKLIPELELLLSLFNK